MRAVGRNLCLEVQGSEVAHRRETTNTPQRQNGLRRTDWPELPPGTLAGPPKKPDRSPPTTGSSSVDQGGDRSVWVVTMENVTHRAYHKPACHRQDLVSLPAVPQESVGGGSGLVTKPDSRFWADWARRPTMCPPKPLTRRTHQNTCRPHEAPPGRRAGQTVKVLVDMTA